jgi:hypothetical protein
MAYDLRTLRQARAMAIALRSSRVSDKKVPEELSKNGIDPALAPIVLRHLDVQRAEELAANGRRDIHYGILTAGSAAVVAVASSVFPPLTVVFGLAIVGGLLWIARGMVNRWRADRIAPGIYKGQFRELHGGYAGDMLKDPDEVLAERAAFAVSIKRARNNANYFSYFFTGAVFLALLFPMSTVNDPNAFLFLLGITFAVFFAALFASYELLFRAEGLPPPRLFSKNVVPETNEPVQRYSAPHFSDAPAGGDEAVLLAPAHDELPAQSAITKYKDDTVFGVLYATTQGIAFLPDVPVDNAELRAMGRVAADLAAQAHPLAELLRDTVLGKPDVPDTLPQWFSKALGHPSHFVIAWADLVEAGHDPKTRQTMLVKDDDAGTRQTYTLSGLGNLMAPFLFNLKLRYERNKVVVAVDLQPRYERLEAELAPHFKQLYGDLWPKHSDELHKAIIARMSGIGNEPADEAEINRRLAPLKPAMQSTPALVVKDGAIQFVADEPPASPSPSSPPNLTA